ncbi:hypothetical protein Y032_0549g3288 [Ancylostoma ceylanicum]|uniref:Uncharacterized protein n=1 Tax=Ancylostoma ceylanicum TaxID=53326 RepID=A0A016WSG3_9BILA|nr:hypothetical protein Y032_0549g3288 [Ancylostoma ceylanicum]
MVKRTGTKMATDVDGNGEMPVWASKMIERFDSYSSCIQQSLTDTFDHVFSKLKDLQEAQALITSRLSELESKTSSFSPPHSQQNLLYSTMVKIRADSHRIDENSR